MAVYVGPLVAATFVRGKWPWDQAATMYADTLDELHAMAARIGVGRCHFRDDVRLQHYRLSPRGVREALKAGAVSVDKHAVAKRIAAGQGPSRGRAGTLFGESGRML